MLDSVSGRRRIPPRDTAPHARKLANEKPLRRALPGNMPHRPLPVGSKLTDRACGTAGSGFAVKATDRVWASNQGGKVGRPGCGSPTARPGEHNSRPGPSHVLQRARLLGPRASGVPTLTQV